MKKKFFLLALLVWPCSFLWASESHLLYKQDYAYSEGVFSICVICSENNASCDMHIISNKDVRENTTRKNGLLQERNAIEDAILHMQAMHIAPKNLHRIFKRITSSEERDKLALSAIRSEEWRHLMDTFQTTHPDFGKLHALFGKLLMESGAYNSLNIMLAQYGLKMQFLGVEKILNEKFYKLHIPKSDVKSDGNIRVPIDGEITFSVSAKN